MGEPHKKYSSRLIEEKSRKKNSPAMSAERKDTNSISAIKGRGNQRTKNKHLKPTLLNMMKS